MTMWLFVRSTARSAAKPPAAPLLATNLLQSALPEGALRRCRCHPSGRPEAVIGEDRLSLGRGHEGDESAGLLGRVGAGDHGADNLDAGRVDRGLIEDDHIVDAADLGLVD